MVSHKTTGCRQVFPSEIIDNDCKMVEILTRDRKHVEPQIIPIHVIDCLSRDESKTKIKFLDKVRTTIIYRRRKKYKFSYVINNENKTIEIYN